MDWSYVAGFWDGEGTVSLARGGDPNYKGRYVSITACQSTPQDECLREMQKFLYDEGIESRIYIAKPNGPRRHPVSKLYITGNRTNKLRFMLNVRGLCIVKREKLETAIEFIQNLKYYSTQYDVDEKKRRCEAALATYNTGKSVRESAYSNNITHKTLNQYIRDRGIRPRTRSESLSLSWKYGRKKQRGTSSL